jgi:hypothetical protein
MRIGLWLVTAYVIVCALALAAIPLSAAGWITPDPLSAVPAILLGLPWSSLLLRLGDPQSLVLNLSLMALSMAINAAILWLLVRVVSRRSQGKKDERPY